MEPKAPPPSPAIVSAPTATTSIVIDHSGFLSLPLPEQAKKASETVSPSVEKPTKPLEEKIVVQDEKLAEAEKMEAVDDTMSKKTPDDSSNSKTHIVELPHIEVAKPTKLSAAPTTPNCEPSYFSASSFKKQKHAEPENLLITDEDATTMQNKPKPIAPTKVAETKEVPITPTWISSYPLFEAKNAQWKKMYFTTQDESLAEQPLVSPNAPLRLEIPQGAWQLVRITPLGQNRIEIVLE